MSTVVKNKSRKRVAVRKKQIGQVSWTQEIYGGCGEGTVPLNAATTDFPNIVPLFHADYAIGSEIAYRGRVQKKEPQNSNAELLQLRLYGLMADMDKIICTAPVVCLSTADLSDLVTKIVTLWVRPKFDSTVLSLDINTTGENIAVYDCTGKSVKQVLDELCDLTGIKVYWGFDVDSGGLYRLYLRTIGATTHVISVPGNDCNNWTGGVDITELANRLVLTGGTMEKWRQNLIPNASFEKPVVPGTAGDDGVVIGSLLTNGGFESGGVHNAWSLVGWTQVGGASAKQNGGGDGGADGDPGDPDAYSGTWCIELSDSTEKATQDVKVIAGRVYGLRAFMRPSDVYTAVNGQVQLFWFDSGMSPISSDLMTTNVSTAAWQRFDGEFTAPTGAAFCRISLEGTAGSGNSLLFDAISFWDRSAVSQNGWIVKKFGTGDVVMQWDATAALHGVYCAKATVSGVDDTSSGGSFWASCSFSSNSYTITVNTSTSGIATGQTVTGYGMADGTTVTGISGTTVTLSQRTTLGTGRFGYSLIFTNTVNEVTLCPSQAISISANALYEFFVWLKTAGQSSHAGKLRLTWYDADGIGTVNEYHFTGSGLSSWTWGSLSKTAPSGSVAVLPEVVFRSDGDWFVDALTLMDDRGTFELFAGADATHAPGDGTVPYQIDGVLQLVINAQDVVTSGEDVEVNTSQSLYEVREARETIESIVTYTDARKYAKAWALRRAKLLYRPTVTIVGERPVKIGDIVRLVGKYGATLSGNQDLPVMRIRASEDPSGVLSRVLELGRPQLTQGYLVRNAAKQEVVRVR